MALLTNINISIDGEIIPSIKEFTLVEQIGEHASFSLFLRNDVVESISDTSGLLESSREFLGKSFIVQISSAGNLGYEAMEFKGIVTSVNDEQGFFNSSGNTIKLEGKSGSIVLDDGPHMSSFTYSNLSEIINQVLSGYDTSKLSVDCTPEHDQPLPYVVQNKESGFQFLQRIAACNGEFLLYHRDTLYFGKPDLGDDVILVYGHDLSHFSLGVAIESGTYKYYNTNYFNNETASATTTDVAAGSQGYIGVATNVADTIYHKETNIYHSAFDNPQSQQQLDRLVTLQKKVIEQRQVTLTGVSDNPGVGLGKVVNIQDNSGSYGQYRVTQATHQTNGSGKYQNKFVAVPIDIDVYPLTNIHCYPKGEVQIATVMENVDPEKMGRIKVQFPWQQLVGEITPWIRVATPYAGLDKGIFFNPELGQEVLIGFENGNAEKPYMTAALYNSTANPQSWQTDNNDIKALRTRSGHTLEFNDTDGHEMITITDKNNNRIQFDTVRGTIKISAPESIHMESKNIKIIAQEHIDIQSLGTIETKAEGNIDMATQGNISLLSEGTTQLQATGDTTLSSDAAVQIEAATDAVVLGQNVTVTGEIEASLTGTQTKVHGQTTVVQGASGKIDIV